MEKSEIPLIGENIFIYGQIAKIVEVEKFNDETTLLHLEKPIVVPDSRYTTDVINLNEYIK